MFIFFNGRAKVRLFFEITLIFYQNRKKNIKVLCKMKKKHANLLQFLIFEGNKSKFCIKLLLEQKKSLVSCFTTTDSKYDNCRVGTRNKGLEMF